MALPQQQVVQLWEEAVSRRLVLVQGLAAVDQLHQRQIVQRRGEAVSRLMVMMQGMDVVHQ